MKTKLFFYDKPYAKDATGNDAGKWVEITSDSTTQRDVYLEQGQQMYLSWPITQEEYLNRLIQHFGYFPEDYDAEYVPSVIYISAKFVTTDVTNGNFVEDEFQIMVFSSNEGFSSLCSY
jgi:hypothetical protein